jgi:hypothetical protein
MEWKEKLIEWKNNNVFLRITFKYPQFNSFTFRRGYITDVFDDGFGFDDVIEGKAVYSKEYIVEVKEVSNEKDKS